MFILYAYEKTAANALIGMDRFACRVGSTEIAEWRSVNPGKKGRASSQFRLPGIFEKTGKPPLRPFGPASCGFGALPGNPPNLVA